MHESKYVPLAAFDRWNAKMSESESFRWLFDLFHVKL